MANQDSPTGFRALRTLGGGELATNPYEVDSSNAVAIGRQDLVSGEADGNVTRSSADDGNIVIGAVSSIKDENGKPIDFLPANTAAFLQVYDNPNTVYAVQSDSGTVVNSSDIFATANHVDTAPNADTGLSTQELDSSDIGTGLQLRILGRYRTEDNNFGEENVELEVVLNENLIKGTASI